MDEAKLGKGRISMHIYMDFMTFTEEAKKEQDIYFNLLCKNLEANGYDLKWSRIQYGRGTAKVGTITTEDKVFRTMESILIGYCFCGSHPGMHPLSSKALVENFEEIVLKQNQERLNELYVQEYKVIKRTNKERND
jgi:hypothetical protein